MAYKPIIRATLEVHRVCGLSVGRLIFEIMECGKVEKNAHLKAIIEYYQREGVLTAIGGFGAGYPGLNLVAEI